MAKKKKKFKTDFFRFNEIKIPKAMFNPIKTGITAVDVCLSEIGGFIPGQVILMTGIPGAGKTTLCLNMIEKMSVDKKKIVLVELEMSDFQLKLQAKKFKGLNNKNVLISVSDNINNLLADLKKMKPDLVVIDSLQKMANSKSCTVKWGSSLNSQMRLVEAFTKYAKESLKPVILIGHVGKNGNYIGPSAIKHEVDCHMHIDFDKDMQERTFEFEKNRFGGLMLPVPFYINGNGIIMDNSHIDLNEIEKEDEALPDAAAITKSIMEIREINKNRTSGVSLNALMPTANHLLKYIRLKYKTEFKNSCKIDPVKIQIFKDKTKKNSYCQYNQGKIYLSENQFNILTDGTLSAYKKERPFMEEFCRTKEDVAIWIILHEITHLFAGCEKHTLDFFKRVARLAKENSFLFSNNK